LIYLYDNKCCLICTTCLSVGHCTASGVIMLHLKFWACAIFCFREIMFGVDPISRSAEMGVVRFMGVTPLECNKSVPTLQNKNLKEHYICCVEHKICTIGISFCNKVTKIAIFRLSSHLKLLTTQTRSSGFRLG